MLNRVLDSLIVQSNGHIITNSNVGEYIKNKWSYNVEIIDDSRSATFFAFGESKISGKPSILIIDEEDAASTYTGITEAHYQNVSIFIVLVSKNETWDFWGFCTEKQYIVRNDDELKNIMPIIEKKSYSPILIKIYDDKVVNNERKKLPKIELNLEEIIDSETQIFIHNIEYSKKTDKIILDKSSKYGILSRYVGYIQYSNSKDILICRESDLKLDINIFNARYINDNFKAIIISDETNSCDFEKWINNNNIIYREEKELNEKNLNEVLNSPKAHLLMIKGGK